MHKGHENKGNDHQLKNVLIVKQMLLVSTLGKVWKTVWRLCILMLGYYGLTTGSSQSKHGRKINSQLS